MNSKQSRGVQSGQRMMAILDCLRQGERGLRSIAQELGLPPSTTHRLLATLLDGGLVEQRSDSTYRLGVKLIELGFAALDQHDLRQEALPEMEELSRETRLTINLAQLDGQDIIYIEKVSDQARFALNIGVGARQKAYCRALGKVLLAYLEETDLKKRLPIPLPRETKNTITDVDELIQHLAQVKKQGYATDYEEAQIGCVCVAAPIKDSRGRVVAAVSVSGTTTELQAQPMESWTSLVTSSAERISRRVGFSR